MAKTTKAQEQAAKFAAACKEAGFTYIVKNSIIVFIEKSFTPGDKDAFAFCDMDAPGVLALAPLKGGSVWGTDGGSVGGQSGLDRGHFVMYKSGEGKRFLNALSKLEG